MNSEERRKEIDRKFQNGEDFTEGELKYLVQYYFVKYKYVREDVYLGTYWETLIRYNNKYYVIKWRDGDYPIRNEYDSQPVEVNPITRLVEEIVDWELINDK